MDAEHYIRETLGLPCQITSWNGTASLPLFLTNGRTFSKLTIDNTSMLIASGEAHPFSITRVTADGSAHCLSVSPAFCIPAKSPDSESRSFHRARYPTVYPFTGHGVHPAHLLTAAGERTGYRGATLLPRNTAGLAVFALLQREQSPIRYCPSASVYRSSGQRCRDAVRTAGIRAPHQARPQQ